tara:strand:+ start:502 stop:705 length:204 start_codon:yes stop_codon:yes gene_type:complete
MTPTQAKEVVAFLVEASFELGNQDGCEWWGWDGLGLAKIVAKDFGINDIHQQHYTELKGSVPTGDPR